MPRPPTRPPRHALLALGLTGTVLAGAAVAVAAVGTTGGPLAPTPPALEGRKAGSDPVPPINRAVPQPLPPTRDPVEFTRLIATALWGSQPSDTVGYQIMAAASPHLGNPEVEHLTQVIDNERVAGPETIGQISLAGPSGIDHAVTVTVRAVDPTRTLTIRTSCAPVCQLLGITR